MDQRLTCKTKTLKFLEENRENFYNVGFGKDFLDMIPKAQTTKVKISKLDFIKIKKLCMSMENNKNEDNIQNGRKNSQVISDKGHYRHYIKNYN